MTVTTQGSVQQQRLGMSKVAWKKALLLSGAASVLVYIGLDATAALLTDDYSYLDQAPSELSAVGAPTRALWMAVGSVYAVFVIGFGYGVWAAGERQRSLRIVAAAVVLVGILGLIAWPLAPMHDRETLAAGGGTLSDTMHLVLGAADVILFFLMIAFGAGAGGKSFRNYSIATIVLMLAFGFYTGTQAPNVQANEPTPWMGLAERVAVFAPMLWMAVLGITLWRRPGHA